MHICFISSEYPKFNHSHGGIGTFVQTLARELVRKGINVSVVGINYTAADEFERDQGVMIYRCKSRKIAGLTWILNTLSIFMKLKEIHKLKKIDIIEGSELSFAFIRKFSGVKYVIRLHGGHHFFAEAENRVIDRWKGFQEKRSFNNADVIIGVGRYVMDHTAKYIDFKSKRGPVIYNPIDLNKFFVSDSSKVEVGRIFFAGTLCEKKGIRELIQSFSIIKKQCPEAKLYIAGRDTRVNDGESFSEYLQKFIDPDYFDSILFLGQVDNDKIPELIEKSEVCVYPSHMESFGLVAVEAMSMAKPTVFTKVGPGPEIISHGITGLLCDPLIPEDIADKIIFILKNKNMAYEMGKKARAEVIERFDKRILVEKNITFYQSLI